MGKMREALKALADKWETSEYAISEINNPLLPQEQCAIELRELLAAEPSETMQTALVDARKHLQIEAAEQIVALVQERLDEIKKELAFNFF
jgi:hypothetical protein